MAYWISLNGTIFFDILKKYDFSRFWLNFFFSQKNLSFQKWKKIIFDGVFELAIVDLVDTECFNFKNS